MLKWNVILFKKMFCFLLSIYINDNKDLRNKNIQFF